MLSSNPRDRLTSNYSLALQKTEVKCELNDKTADKQYGVRLHILSVDVKRPTDMTTSTESSCLLEKHHTSIKIAAKAF